jgi:hypothetical protein
LHFAEQAIYDKRETYKEGQRHVEQPAAPLSVFASLSSDAHVLMLPSLSTQASPGSVVSDASTFKNQHESDKKWKPNQELHNRQAIAPYEVHEQTGKKCKEKKWPCPPEVP